MKRKQDQQQNPIISPESPVTSKRTKEINYDGNNNTSTVYDGSLTNVKNERVESWLNSNQYNLRGKNPPVVDDANIPSYSPIRLQQPPAYINSNLNKIKIESDYVPIVAIKQEPSTGDENQEILQSNNNNDDEDKKVDVSSFSVSSSENNIKSEFSTTDLTRKMQSALDNKSDIKLNVDELQHLLNIIQSSQEKGEDSKIQQEKEKVVVKVESIGDENETENKDKEKIAELEERINKYTKTVIYLHREKHEIQTTLHNQIHQLNLVIGQHKTQLHHSKGIINQQFEEISRLKSQVNHHQQNEIALLNKHNQNQTVEKQDQTIQNPSSGIKNQMAEIQIRMGQNGFAGSRFHLGLSFDDSTCLNCESALHTSFTCPNPPFLRFSGHHQTPDGLDVLENGAVDTSKTAGLILSELADLWEWKLNHREFTRDEITVIFTMYYWDTCCFKCGTPFHPPPCPYPLPNPSGISTVRKLMWNTNHPPTAEQLQLLKEKRERHRHN